MIIKRAHSYQNFVGRSKNVLLAVVKDRIFVDNARLIYRTCYEMKGFTKLERFTAIEYAYNALYSEEDVVVPLPLHRKGCIFVEVVDTTTNTSVVIVLRHADYCSPYNIDDRLMTTLTFREEDKQTEDVSMSEDRSEDESSDEDEVEDFFDNVIKLGEGLGSNKIQIDQVQTITPDESDIITKTIAEYAENKVVDIQTKDIRSANFVTGLYWCDRDHWMSMNAHGTGYRITPSAKGLSSLNAPIEINSTITRMSTHIINKMCNGAKLGTYRNYEAPFLVPNLPLCVTTQLNNGEQSLYRNAVENVRGALLAALNPFKDNSISEQLLFCDYKDTSALLYRRNWYGWSIGTILKNPLHPMVNAFLSERWQMNAYCEWFKKTFLIGREDERERILRNKGELTFIVKGGTITDISYAGKDIAQYGNVNRSIVDMEMAVRTFVKRANDTMGMDRLLSSKKNTKDNYIVRCMGKILTEGFGCEGTYVCKVNNSSGIMNIWSPLFPKTKSVTLDLSIQGTLTPEEILRLPVFIKTVSDFVQGAVTQ